jgi:hypothetical protein
MHLSTVWVGSLLCVRLQFFFFFLRFTNPKLVVHAENKKALTSSCSSSDPEKLKKWMNN